jgi:hypothetical protein
MWWRKQEPFPNAVVLKNLDDGQSQKALYLTCKNIWVKRYIDKRNYVHKHTVRTEFVINYRYWLDNIGFHALRDIPNNFSEGYLTTLSVCRLYRVVYRMVSEYGANTLAVKISRAFWINCTDLIIYYTVTNWRPCSSIIRHGLSWTVCVLCMNMIVVKNMTKRWQHWTTVTTSAEKHDLT